jgi:type I restriction enzyme R subunit
LRDYQLDAIKALQDNIKKGKDRFLFEMATGTGKTLVSAAVIKLFLRTGNARRANLRLHVSIPIAPHRAATH